VLPWSLVNVQVLQFNGAKLKNLRHLAELVMECSDKYLRFECEYSEVIIVERQPAVMGTGKVLETHSIPAAMSKDLRELLEREWPPVEAADGTAAVAAVGAGAGVGAEA
jgi:hypothetical protein